MERIASDTSHCHGVTLPLVRSRFQPWQLALLLIAVCAASVAGVYLYRARGGSDPSALASYLPTTNATVVYVDVDALRRSGILKMITGSKAAEELEYRQFVDQTSFDYREDLDSVAAAFKDGQVFFALKGRFHWKNLMDYAIRQGGSCHNSFCTAPSSRPNRRISFYPVRPDLMGLAISQDDFAAYQVARKSGTLTLAPPLQPVWVLVPAMALRERRFVAGRHKTLRVGAAECSGDRVHHRFPGRSPAGVAECPVPRRKGGFGLAARFRKHHGYSSEMDRAGASAPESH